MFYIKSVSNQYLDRLRHFVERAIRVDDDYALRLRGRNLEVAVAYALEKTGFLGLETIG